MRYIIYPYKMGSESSKNLADKLKERGMSGLRVYPDRSYQVRDDDFIINWGNTTLPNWNTDGSRINLNKPQAIELSINKLDTLVTLLEQDVNVPEFTESFDEAKSWLRYGGLVYCRQNLTGHAGQGIVTATRPLELVLAPLYVRGIVPKAEYRVHVFNGEVIDYCKKINIEGHDNVDNLVRNHNGGWTYARNVERIERVEQQAIKSVRALGLDFGAVDIVLSDIDDEAYVLEVNSAPGLMDDGRTLDAYVNAIVNMSNGGNTNRTTILNSIEEKRTTMRRLMEEIDELSKQL